MAKAGILCLSALPILTGIRAPEPRENVFWPAGRAPQGRYTVRVDYWDGCPHPPAPTRYSVMVRVDGQTFELLSGTLEIGNRVEKTFTR